MNREDFEHCEGAIKELGYLNGMYASKLINEIKRKNDHLTAIIIQIDVAKHMGTPATVILPDIKREAREGLNWSKDADTPE